MKAGWRSTDRHPCGSGSPTGAALRSPVTDCRSLVLALALVVAFTLGTPVTAFGWSETARVAVPELSQPGPFPTLTPAVAATIEFDPPDARTSAGARLRALTTQTPAELAVDENGDSYVLSVSPEVGVLSPLNLDLYSATLFTLRRVRPDGTVTTLKSFVAQSEGGLPGAYQETSDIPIGLAIDRSARRLYVSVPGEGINLLSLESGLWSRFVDDDHENWSGEDDAMQSPTGETAPEGTYGSLWENGPAAPGVLAVDPVTHHVFVGDAGGGNAGATAPDRLNLDAITVREFAPEGAVPVGRLVESVGFDAPAGAIEYGAFPGTWDLSGKFPASPGVPRSLLGLNFGTTERSSLDTRLASLTIARGGERPAIVGLSQFEPVDATGGFTDSHVGQIVRSERSEGGSWNASAIQADDTRPFGPRRGTDPPGVEDLVITSRGNYLVPSVDAPELIEVTPAGTSLGVVRAAPGSEACRLAFDRVRLATDAAGKLVVLQQPLTPSGSASIVRIDPAGADAPAPQGCETDLPPEEVERTPPTVDVVGSEYRDGGLPPTGSAFSFTSVGDGDTVTLDEATDTAGWLFSVRVEDEDNQGADFGSAAQCVLDLKFQGGTGNRERTQQLSGGACRPAVDDLEILGASGTGPLNAFTVEKKQLLPEGATAPVPATLKVRVTDDDGAQAEEITVNIVLKTKVRAPIKIDLFEPAKAARDRFSYAMKASGFDEWQVDFGDPAGTRQPPTGFLPASSFPASSAQITYPAPGEYTATLTVRRDGGTKPEDIATKSAKVLVEAEQQQRPVTVVTPQSGAPCDTPLGIPLAQVGLGDQLLCVPADPCDVNTAELGLTKLPIVRPASCAGDDSSLFAAAEGSGPPPLGSRPIFLARTLRLSADRKVAARIRCGTGPSSCAGRVRMQLIRPGKAAATIGTASFKDLVAEKTATVSVKVSAANARLLRRTARPRVRVTVIPSVGATFTRPASHTRTVNLSAPKPRRTR